MAQKRAFSDRNLFGDVGRKDLKGPGQEWSALREKVGETETMVCTLFVPSNMYTYVSIKYIYIYTYIYSYLMLFGCPAKCVCNHFCEGYLYIFNDEVR